MGSLERRMWDLESALSSDVCPVCGDGSHLGCEVVFDDAESEGLEDELEEPEFCEGCARQLNTIIYFEDPLPASAWRVPQREERIHGE
jgi:hypothetical protein